MPLSHSSAPARRVIVWLRHDLRLHDHENFTTLGGLVEEVLPMYVFDPREFAPDRYIGAPKTGPHRAAFLLETVLDLQTRLRAIGSDLYIAHGAPETVLPELVRQFEATEVRATREHTSEESTVETAVETALRGVGARLRLTEGLLLHHPDDLPIRLADLPLGFTKFRQLVEKRLRVRDVFAPITSLPGYPAQLGVGAVPTLAALTGHPDAEDAAEIDPRTAHPFQGGETAALARLDDYIHGRRLLGTYKQTRNGLMGEAFSSKLSAWLANGSLSPRQVYHEVRRYEARHGANDSTYWLLFELLWRDFFRLVALRVGTAIFRPDGLRGQAPRPHQRPDRALFDRWTQGRTGAPFVDAAMRELRLTGWTSNRMRQNVASYLINTLRLDWRWGAAWFESRLVDYDPCSNWANWQYLAGTGTDAREGRAFDIGQQARAYDPQGAYQRYWAG